MSSYLEAVKETWRSVRTSEFKTFDTLIFPLILIFGGLSELIFTIFKIDIETKVGKIIFDIINYIFVAIIGLIVIGTFFGLLALISKALAVTVFLFAFVFPGFFFFLK